jgi:hypothetical protein
LKEKARMATLNGKDGKKESPKSQHPEDKKETAIWNKKTK